MQRDILISYSEALFELSLEENKTEKVTKDFLILRDLFDKNPKFLQLFDSPFISIESKYQIIEEDFKDFDKILINFLKIITHDGLIKYIHTLYREYKHLYNHKFNILEGIIYTPYNLDDKEISKICNVFEKKLNSKVVFKVIIDERIIAGIKVLVNDTIYDYTLNTKLDEIKSNLMFNS